MNHFLHSHHTLLKLLDDGLSQLHQTYPRTLEVRLLDHGKLMWKQKKLFNLTKYYGFDTFISRNILECLSIAPYLKNQTFILDAGTGAGLPGVPLAITMPKKRFLLLDNNLTKIKFLQQACYHLKLNNVQIVHDAIEKFKPEKNQLFNGVVCRSFGIFPQLLNQFQPLLAPGAKILVMKGIYPETEIKTIQSPFHFINAHLITVPHINAERHLLEIDYKP
jgi:16S rRNA (guanine527-N7)-methyltransferase